MASHSSMAGLNTCLKMPQLNKELARTSLHQGVGAPLWPTLPKLSVLAIESSRELSLVKVAWIKTIERSRKLNLASSKSFSSAEVYFRTRLKAWLITSEPVLRPMTTIIALWGCPLASTLETINWLIRDCLLIAKQSSSITIRRTIRRQSPSRDQLQAPWKWDLTSDKTMSLKVKSLQKLTQIRRLSIRSRWTASSSCKTGMRSELRLWLRLISKMS